MGGDLTQGQANQKPTLLAWATQDPMGEKLQSLQLIKGWIDADGGMRNRVIPMLESEGGAGSFCTVYSDDSFDPSQPTYYYVRAVEPPTPRWHTFDCAQIAAADRPAVCTNGEYPETIQEMAWSSPIWYRQE